MIDVQPKNRCRLNQIKTMNGYSIAKSQVDFEIHVGAFGKSNFKKDPPASRRQTNTWPGQISLC